MEDLFPDLDLCQRNLVSDVSSHNLVETYVAYYGNGVCYLNMYEDGDFEAYGYESIPSSLESSSNLMSEGFSVTSDGYKSYYRSAIYGLSYTYSVSTNNTTNRSTISNKGNFSQYGTQYAYFSLNSLTYTRATQTSSSPAELVGSANLFSDGYDSGAVYELVTTVTSGTIAVSLNVST